MHIYVCMRIIYYYYYVLSKTLHAVVNCSYGLVRYYNYIVLLMEKNICYNKNNNGD